MVLPGVGAARATMERLHATGLVEPLQAAASDGRPFLGVCLGLQLLFEHHEEGDVAGLGVLPGVVRRFPAGLKVPHMGWNTVQAEQVHPFLAGIDPNPYFYFVHSYYVAPTDRHSSSVPPPTARAFAAFWRGAASGPPSSTRKRAARRGCACWPTSSAASTRPLRTPTGGALGVRGWGLGVGDW